MKLSRSHDTSCEFNKLTQVDYDCFLLFLIVFYFIIQLWVDWKLSFIIFYFIFVKLSRSNNLSYEFGMLTRVVFCHFLNFFQFHLLTLD